MRMYKCSDAIDGGRIATIYKSQIGRVRIIDARVDLDAIRLEGVRDRNTNWLAHKTFYTFDTYTHTQCIKCTSMKQSVVEVCCFLVLYSRCVYGRRAVLWFVVATRLKVFSYLCWAEAEGMEVFKELPRQTCFRTDVGKTSRRQQPINVIMWIH